MTTFSHPAFAPYRALLDRLAQPADLAALNALAAESRLCHANGRALRFVGDPLPRAAADYERMIHDTGCIPTRPGNLHDFFNALVWLRFPALKSALNQRHCERLAEDAAHGQRGRVRDQLTLLDESGVLVASPRRDLLAMLQQKRWVALFWEARSAVERQMRFVVVGHGLLEKCVQPFAAMTGKCLLMPTEGRETEGLDRLAAAQVLETPLLALPPLPILGIPAWDANASRAYYENTAVFRRPRGG